MLIYREHELLPALAIWVLCFLADIMVKLSKRCSDRGAISDLAKALFSIDMPVGGDAVDTLLHSIASAIFAVHTFCLTNNKVVIRWPGTNDQQNTEFWRLTNKLLKKTMWELPPWAQSSQMIWEPFRITVHFSWLKRQSLHSTNLYRGIPTPL